MPLAERSLPHTEARRLGSAGLKAFFRLADLWELDTEEQRVLLGDPKRSTFFEWKKQPDRELSRDTLERLSYLLGIYKALEILLPDPTIADRWVRTPAEILPFGGKTPLRYMLRGDMAALLEVRQYLDAWRGAW
jgi:hypothetical protein